MKTVNQMLCAFYHRNDPDVKMAALTQPCTSLPNSVKQLSFTVLFWISAPVFPKAQCWPRDQAQSRHSIILFGGGWRYQWKAQSRARKGSEWEMEWEEGLREGQDREINQERNPDMEKSARLNCIASCAHHLIHPVLGIHPCQGRGPVFLSVGVSLTPAWLPQIMGPSSVHPHLVCSFWRTWLCWAFPVPCPQTITIPLRNCFWDDSEGAIKPWITTAPSCPAP